MTHLKVVREEIDTLKESRYFENIHFAIGALAVGALMTLIGRSRTPKDASDSAGDPRTGPARRRTGRETCRQAVE